MKAILSDTQERQSMLLDLLYFRNNVFGYIVYDCNFKKGFIYETLSSQISTALQGALMFKKQKESEEKLKNTLSKIGALNKKLEYLSIRDEMTGLYNRRGFFTLAEQHIKMAERDNKKFLIFYIDLDNLKQINDKLGHKEGDNAIIKFSEILKSTFRKPDIIARLGGDEFVVLVFNTGSENYPLIEEKLRKHILKFNAKEVVPFKISASLGFAEYDFYNKQSLEELLHLADQRLYQEKENK